MSERTVDVLIADDHPFVRLGVRTLLTAQPDFRVVGEATDGDEAIHLAQQLKPDVLVLDLAMPRLPGLDALREVTAGTASVKTILLTSAIDSRQVLEALQLGAREFDTCLGGMGGCPYCGNGRSAGHVPTEDLVDLCHEMGIETGYKLDKLIDAVAVAEEVVGHPLWGHVSKSGARPRGAALYPADMPFVETLEEAAHFRNGPEVYQGQLSPWREGDALVRR